VKLLICLVMLLAYTVSYLIYDLLIPRCGLGWAMLASAAWAAGCTEVALRRIK